MKSNINHEVDWIVLLLISYFFSFSLFMNNRTWPAEVGIYIFLKYFIIIDHHKGCELSLRCEGQVMSPETQNWVQKPVGCLICSLFFLCFFSELVDCRESDSRQWAGVWLKAGNRGLTLRGYTLVFILFFLKYFLGILGFTRNYMLKLKSSR
jgi:hypothetical protein